MENLNQMLQKGLQKVADTLEHVDFETLGQNVQSAAARAAKTVGSVAMDAAREAESVYQEAKENRAKPGGIGDYRVSGSSVLDGGCYNRISTSGVCKVSSDLVCRELKTSGSFRACGSVDCNGEVRTSGGFHCEGDLIAGDFSGSGTAKVQGNLKSGLMHVPGALTVGGNLSAGELRVSGSLKVGGDCEADSFTASGSLNVGGIINADTVDIRLSVAESRVGSIGGAQVTVSQSSTAGFLSSILKPGVGSLTCESIEGDTVELSGVKAASVRGSRVVIHGGCAIDQVEYSETCSIDDGAVVGNCVKI
jgi:cytoskeletal protein CcmA (bactofilin family)